MGSFLVDDLVAFAKASEAKGYPLSAGPTPRGSGMIAFIDAPEGNEVERIERKRSKVQSVETEAVCAVGLSFSRFLA